MNPSVVQQQGYVCCEHAYALHMRAIGRQHWRALLDPRDPDYEEEDEDAIAQREEDAAEDAYLDSRTDREELEDAALAEDQWLHGRGY